MISAKLAQEMHPGLSERDSVNVEVNRVLATEAKLGRTSRVLREYLEVCEMKTAQKLEYEDDKGYSPELVLAGQLEELYIRVLAGHGTETKTIALLLANEVMLSQHLVREDREYMHGTINHPTSSVKRLEDGVHVYFQGLPSLPKNLESAPEPPGYYSAEIIFTDDKALLERVESDAKIRYKKAEAELV